MGQYKTHGIGESVWDGLWRPGGAFFQIGFGCVMSHHHIEGLSTLLFKFWRENSKWSSCQQLVSHKHSLYLYRKGLKALYLTASLAFRQPLSHPTPSVFHADQRGIGGFLIGTLGPELWGHPHPHGGPQRQQGQELILEHNLNI